MQNPPMTLRADLHHATATRNNASVSLTEPLQLRVPANVPVRRGHAGHGTVHLSYREPGSSPVRCDYIGGSAEAHPSTDLERVRGLVYAFSSCSDGTAAGASKTVDNLK